MLRAAVFSALTVILPDLIGPEYLLVEMSRDDVRLASNAGDPEAVDDVTRLKIHVHNGPLR